MTTAADVTPWIGLGLTALGMALGGMAYVQTKVEKVREQSRAELSTEKRELEDRHKLDMQRIEKGLEDERQERRRELDKMGETIKGFADVAAAVIAMGKSVEHLAERFNDHQRETKAALEEIKQEVRSTPRPTRTRTKAAKGG